MRIFKSDPLLKLINIFVIDSPQPSNLNYWWNFGSLLAFSLIIQIITGVTLAMHYNTDINESFNSVEHIMRDINDGWLIRYLHSNTASAFFFIVYLHIGRGLYYGSYKIPRTLVWALGTVILIFMMGIAFLGYVLPFGQMSLWGATVITSLMSAIPWLGQDLVEFVWGGFSVNGATLNRFFALHFVLPFVLAALALMHLITLHEKAGSGNPLGVNANADRIPFAPYYIFKDLITIFIFILGLSVLVFYLPNLLGDSENYVKANPMQTPPSIVPEWYLLPFYAILRSIPNKLLGVIAMFTAILMLLVMALTDISKSRGIQFNPLSKIVFFIFIANFLILTQLGGEHVESPFIEFGQISTVLYFFYFFIIIPNTSTFENSLSELSLNENKIKNEVQVDTKIVEDYIVPDSAIAKSFVFTSVFFNAPKKLEDSSDLSDVLQNKSELSLESNTSNIYCPNSNCDAPRPWGLYFQDSGTPQTEALIELHDNIAFYLIIILFGVGWLLTTIINKFSQMSSPLSHKFATHGTSIEIIWTITPAIILILIAFPSFKLLYLMDEISDPTLLISAKGQQWYWSYLYNDFLNRDDESIEFDSYLIPEADLQEGALRMLDVDNRLIIPELTHTKFGISGGDVIHSFACPALGLKCDAYPGRLNQSSLIINRPSTFYGQCSEICGLLHSSMPIVIEAVSPEKFVKWLNVQ